MTNDELIKRARNGEVIGDGSAQIRLLVQKLQSIEFERDMLKAKRNWKKDYDELVLAFTAAALNNEGTLYIYRRDMQMARSATIQIKEDLDNRRHIFTAKIP